MTTDYRLKAAKEAAAKVNAMLVATGQLRPSDLNKGRSKPGKSSDLFVEEVVINDAPMSARNFLTRSFTQEEISKMSGASVSTRGRYMTQEEIDNNTSNDRPLYLHIQGVNQQDVKVAVGRIMHLIMEHTHRKGNSHHHKGKGHRASSGQNTGGGSRQGDRSPRMDKASTESIEPINENKIFPQSVLREKVFLPSTANLNPVEIRIRLAGDNNSNMKYIQDETGATIFMRGIGSGFIEPSTGMESQEALHFYLEHQNQDQFNQAKDLVVNLAQTILSQIHQEQSQEHIHPPPNSIPQQGFQQNHLGQIPLNGGSVIPPPPPAVSHQISAGNQTILPAVTQQVPPGMIPTQLGVQVNPVQLPQTPQLLIPTQVPAPNTIPTQSIQELQQASVAHGAQLLQISVPSSVGGPSLVSQQLVQTSAGPQLVHLPHGTQIVSTLDGPRLVSLAPVSSGSTAFITQSVQSNAVADQHPLSVALSQTVPQPLPQPVPQPVPHPLPQNCNVPGFGQGETYVFDTEQRKFPSSPVIMTSTSNTFAFIPQEPLQQTVVPTTTLPVEISQSQQWHPPTNSVVLSHVCSTPAVADVTFAQAPQTQATFVRPPIMSHTSENFPCGDISNHHLTDPIRPNSEWNIDIGGKPSASHYLETTASSSEVVRDSSLSKDREESSLTSDPNRHVADQRSPLKTSQYMWAQYPNVSYGSVHCAPHDKAMEDGRNNETYNSIVGGSQQNEKEPQNNNSSSETFVKDDALQGTRHVLRNSPSAGGFSGEPKRRRSFKPKGDFHGPNRIMKREHDKPFPNRPSQVSLNEQFYNDDVNLRTSFDYSPSTSKMSAYPRSMRREDFHMRNRSDMGGTYYGDPNADKMRNPWIWNRNDRNLDSIAGPSQTSNYNHRSKTYDSPWESGIPGVQIGKEMPRPNEPLVNRNKFPKKKFNRLY